MTTLYAGDTIQKGDKKRRVEKDGWYSDLFKSRHSNEFSWFPANLIGHTLLRSDLMAFDFLRP